MISNIIRVQKSPTLVEKFKSDVQIISLLQVLDKYFVHLRKLKHLKNETVKANIAAAREANKNAAKASKVNENPAQVEAPQQTQEPAEDVKIKSNSKKSMKSNEDSNNKENATKDTTEEAPDTAPCKILTWL